MTLRNRSWLATPLLLSSVSCGTDPVGPDPEPQPAFAGAAATANPINVVSATVEVNATLFDSAQVAHWTTGTARQTTPSASFGSDSIVTLPVLGLNAGADYEFEINLLAGETDAMFDGEIAREIPDLTSISVDTGVSN